MTNLLAAITLEILMHGVDIVVKGNDEISLKLFIERLWNDFNGGSAFEGEDFLNLWIISCGQIWGNLFVSIGKLEKQMIIRGLVSRDILDCSLRGQIEQTVFLVALALNYNKPVIRLKRINCHFNINEYIRAYKGVYRLGKGVGGKGRAEVVESPQGGIGVNQYKILEFILNYIIS
jgi:hypothetical protein